MRTALTDMPGVGFPLVAFSHCRDVVAAVTNSGGFGMLGAVRFTPGQLDEELSWLDRETHVEFARDLLLRHGIISEGHGFRLRPAAAVQYEEQNVKALLGVAFAHPVKLAAASSADTTRSRVRTGKLARQLRSAWHDEWESAASPGALPMPLMEMIESYIEAVGRLNEISADD